MRWPDGSIPKPLPPEVIQELVELGYKSDQGLDYFQELWRREGEHAFWRILKCEWEFRENRDEYEPRLRDYAAKCRLEMPLPPLSKLSVPDRAKYEILCNFIEAFHLEGILSPDKVIKVHIVWGNLITLLAARTTLGERADSLVLLLEEEKLRWFNEIYQHPRDFSRWYSLHWWKIEEFQELDNDDKEFIEQKYSKADGIEYWVLTKGNCLGGLGFWETSQLWKWNGFKADPIEVFASVEGFP